MRRKCSRALVLFLVVIVPVLLLGAGSGRADEDNNRGAVKLLAIVPIPTTLVPLRAFDISWVDAATQLYYLGDRSNASVDVVDAKTNQFVRAIKAMNPPFAGVALKAGPTPPGGQVADNDRSGPNGVVVSGNFLFVTDASSRVRSIDLRTDTVVSLVSTGGDDELRADELAYDPQDGILLVVNNADDPPFATLISVNKTTGHLTVGPRITFDTANTGVDATNGAEQPAWDPRTRKFYVSIPEVNCPNAHTKNPDPRCGGKFPTGAVVRIDPHSTGAVEKEFLVDLCQPAGLTLGPHQDLLIGCSVVFDTAGKAWKSTDPTSIAAPTQIIIDAKTGEIDARVAGVGGSDEVWFNPGDRRYYTASRNNPTGPVLGVIDAESQSLVQIVPTINTPGQPTANPVVVAGTAHSVAVNSRNNHALVPLPANNVFLDPNDASHNCSNGCIAVFGTPNGEDHD